VQRRLDDFRRHLDSVADTLMTGRGLRGRTARQTRAAIGHALAFTTWRSLTNQEGLSDEDALALLSTLIEQAAHPTTARADHPFSTKGR
jgi:hypothetical protein